MLDDIRDDISEGTSKRCKPDYEGQIKRQQRSLIRVEIYLQATLNYLDGSLARNKMAELVGELVTLRDSLEKKIQYLVEAQEKEGGE